MEQEVFSLKDITVEKLVNTGVTFDMNNIEESLNEVINDEEEDEFRDRSICDPLGSYKVEPLTTLWDKMKPLDEEDHIRKLIIKPGSGDQLKKNSRIKILYCGYFDGEQKPYDSTGKKSPQTLNLQDSGLLPGMDIAIRSMLVGEHAKFLIHHSLMYGELGCPPHIPKKALCLQHVILLSSTPEDDIPEELHDSLPVLSNVFNQVKSEFRKGVRLYDENRFHDAVKSFQKAMHTVQNCRLASRYDEIEQTKFLKKIYLNLAICYNKTNVPKRACTMCNNYKKIANFNSDWKILLQNAKALRALQDYDLARQRLCQALKLNPTCEEIRKELKIINQQNARSENYKMEFCKFMANAEKENGVSQTVQPDEDQHSFQDEVELLCLSLETDDELKTLTIDLPIGLTDEELLAFEKTVKDRKLLFEIKDNGGESQKTVTISKVLEERSS